MYGQVSITLHGSVKLFARYISDIDTDDRMVQSLQTADWFTLAGLHQLESLQSLFIMDMAVSKGLLTTHTLIIQIN